MRNFDMLITGRLMRLSQHWLNRPINLDFSPRGQSKNYARPTKEELDLPKPILGARLSLGDLICKA